MWFTSCGKAGVMAASCSSNVLLTPCKVYTSAYYKYNHDSSNNNNNNDDDDNNNDGNNNNNI